MVLNIHFGPTRPSNFSNIHPALRRRNPTVKILFQSILTSEMEDATGRGARRGSDEYARRAARLARVPGGDRVHERAGIGAAEDGHGPAAAATGDLGAVHAGLRTRATDERHERVRAAGSESAGGIAGVRLVHERAETLCTLSETV